MKNILTHKAARVISLAESESAKLELPGLSTLSILLGLILEGSGVGAKALTLSGINVQQVYELVEREAMLRDQTPLLLPEIVNESLKVSQKFGQDYIGTEHLLLFIACDTNKEIFDALAVPVSSLRATVLKLIGQPYTPD
ncbi:MAG: Clp protease N-terminal domain-containing protein [Candidatus Melainabacteria bacterium]|nr:Clp protease N-terminal domain-containing protein [Candidatus Melainabacteria bacterium]